jgi:exonuclease III
MSTRANFIVLSEWRDNSSGARLRQSLEDIGYQVVTAAHKNRNGILVATQNDVVNSWRITPMGSERGELLLVDVSGLKILTGYFPQNKAKAPFFSACLDEAARARREPFLLIGDINTGNNHLDIEDFGTPFACAKQFEELQTKGELLDLWRAEHGQKREWTWRSRKNGFRLDHALANLMFRTVFPEVHCTYDHSPRESGFTDHSALIVRCTSQ